MIKPDATAAGNTGKIIDKIIEAGFSIKAMKWTQLSRSEAESFYGVHKERPFYGELVEYITSAPIVAAILEKGNAVEDFRTLIGNTDPQKAAEGQSARCSQRASRQMRFMVLIVMKMQLLKVASSFQEERNIRILEGTY